MTKLNPLDSLNPDDLRTLVAGFRESIARFGTPIPPAEAFRVPARRARAEGQPGIAITPPEPGRVSVDPAQMKRFDPKWQSTVHRCPKCGFTNHVLPWFGVRVAGGVERLQSWCAQCRNRANYHPPARPKGEGVLDELQKLTAADLLEFLAKKRR
jgi:hypothetical protein